MHRGLPLGQNLLQILMHQLYVQQDAAAVLVAAFQRQNIRSSSRLRLSLYTTHFLIPLLGHKKHFGSFLSTIKIYSELSCASSILPRQIIGTEAPTLTTRAEPRSLPALSKALEDSPEAASKTSMETPIMANQGGPFQEVWSLSDQ